MSLQVAFLHERAVAVLAVERLVATMHTDVGGDTEKLGVRSLALETLESLVGSLSLLVLDEDFSVSPREVFIELVRG